MYLRYCIADIWITVLCTRVMAARVQRWYCHKNHTSPVLCPLGGDLGVLLRHPYLPMQLATGKARHSMVGANGTFQWLWGLSGCLWHCSARTTCAYTQDVCVCKLHLLTHGQDCWLILWHPAQPFVEEILQ